MFTQIDRARERIAEMGGEDMLYPNQVQTSLVYAATDDVFFNSATFAQKKDWKPAMTIADAGRLVEHVQRSDYAAKHWPAFFAAPSIVVDNDISIMAGRVVGHYSGAFTDPSPVIRGRAKNLHIAMSADFAQSLPILLHEIAHAVYFYEAGKEAYIEDMHAYSGHGPGFARLNMELVWEFMSPELSTQLLNAYQYAGVKI